MGSFRLFLIGIGALGAVVALSACGFLTQAGTILTGIEVPGPSLWLMQGETPVALDNGQRIETEQGILRVVVKPFPARQKNKIELYLEDRDSKPVDNADIAIQCDMADMSHEIPPFRATPNGKGYYTANLELPMEGTWQLKIAMTRPGESSPLIYVFRLRNDYSGGGTGGHFGH